MMLPLNEHRMIKSCSWCHKSLKQTRLFTAIIRKDSEDDIRKISMPYKKESNVVERDAEVHMSEAHLHQNRPEGQPKTLRCTDSRCTTNFMNTGVDTERYTLELLENGMKGQHRSTRLKTFRRDEDH